ncbi:hydrolase [Tyzzerella sp. An114]|uniref:3'-5' exoribonuclease YhaM family protein n=1 Tax=Tyzzerella sp. An114 TaxID=1965545 RepID=UPI000B435356|nr:3'-5' exoribonuclease YhaM family protein [Tyzzerella sp. An114]OUQ58714.1 hydrolase [Tyzzerella sp. An114]
MRYINEIREGENVVEHFLCKSKQTLKSRAGKSYLSLKLQDKTGTVDAKVWELNNDIKAFEENEFIKIDGTAIVYQNEIQLNVKKIRRSLEGEYDPMDYIPSTEKNIDDMTKELIGYINTIKNTFIKKLLEDIFINNTTISKKIKYHSAAKNIHHGYMGGLVEHTLSVTQICDFMAPRYKYVDRDILIAAAMLHDIGKIYELSDFPENDYTDDGQLLGHIIIGTELITETARNINGFPKKLESILKHCILSHHGEYEYGSPQLPKTIEAFILHCADNMDAKVKVIEEMIDTDSTAGSWVGYQKMLQRNIRKSDY